MARYLGIPGVWRAGNIYARHEGPMTRDTRLQSGKGEISVLIQGNIDVTRWRFRFRGADANNLPILP